MIEGYLSSYKEHNNLLPLYIQTITLSIIFRQKITKDINEQQKPMICNEKGFIFIYFNVKCDKFCLAGS